MLSQITVSDHYHPFKQKVTMFSNSKYVPKVLKMASGAVLKLQTGRLNDTILKTASIYGGQPKYGELPHEFGVKRLAGTKEDGAMRDWFIGECKSLGCQVKVDEIGNIFALYIGKNRGKPTATGSHLDTQPEAGKYDGILGALAGLEVLKTFKENKYVPNYDFCVAVWFNEEGARFSRSCMGSSVWAKLLPLQEAYKYKSINEAKPQSVFDSLKETGYLGTFPASYNENPIDAHFELHIEQGPILEEEKKKIGIVTGVQAYLWEKFTIEGVCAHAGTTPWRSRKDALLMASRFLLAAEDISKKNGGLFTCGTMEIEPFSINVIPNKVSFTLDYRHDSDEIMQKMRSETREVFDKIILENQAGFMKYTSEFILSSDAIKFHDSILKCISDAARIQFKSEEVMKICSGAGHDSCGTSKRVPTGMIFIPSKDGLSHNYQEYSSPEDVQNGFEVLLESILNYDTLRLQRGNSYILAGNHP